MVVGITGGTGVLGKLAYSFLKMEGYEVSCFGGDIRNYKKLSDWLSGQPFSAILHFAALVPVAVVEIEPIRALETNVVGTFNLVKAIKESFINPWVFYASSSHVYKSSSAPIAESFPIEPINFYGLTKFMGENVVQTTCFETKTRCCIGRIFSFWHETQSGEFLYPAMIERFKRENLENPFFVKGANNVRDLSKAKDIVNKIIMLMTKEAEGIYNIGSGTGITIREFVQHIGPKNLKIITDHGHNHDYLVANTSKFDELVKGSKLPNEAL
ncbi:MAG: NAD(P)-dependent oxidoreductase [Parachlamydiaceae bacterium]|nr:NAD(P)-dependent oxidoreductase [Parachlamydiaceae bacterium]